MDKSVEKSDQLESLAGIGAAVDATVGALLFTILGFTADGRTMIRLYSSQPAAYPVGGRKNMSTDVSPEWAAIFAAGKAPYFGRTKQDVRRIFGDHELIHSLGCGAVINVPVTDNGRLIGALNLLNPEGIYTDADVPTAMDIASRSRTAIRKALLEMT